jgi:DNA (cytosine-5)-methyltransferase 1
MKVLSLFSGVGGFDMGLENAGMETVFQCEWDKHCRTILDRHWPTVPKWDDVSTLTGEHILAHAPVIDVVAWGSPCQDLSVAGKRAGLEGGRSGLFYEGMRIITELRKASNGKYPRISIWENVYGALNSNKGEDFEAILKEMVEAGSLLCEWRVLDAQYFGVPQRRRRVFVVAVFDSATAARCPDPLLPISEGLRWHPTTRTTTREEPADTVTASIGSGSQWAAGTSPNGDFLTTSVTSKWHKGSGGPSGSEHYNMVVEELPILIDRAAFNQGENAQYPPHISDNPITPSLVSRGPHAVATIGFSHTQGLDAQPSESAWPTLRKEGNGHAVLTTMVVRRLTPLECERLMGWPDNHTQYKADGTIQADTHRYKQCGNGVASPVAQWIGEQLINL